MIYPENFVPTIVRCDYTVEAVYLFNPTLKPKKTKAYEEDIQDAKLLFYYPQDAHVEEKRNNVGLAEGLTLFFGTFNPSGKQTKTQVIYLDRNVQIISNFETNFWLCIVLTCHSKELTYYQNNSNTNTYISEDCFKTEKANLTYFLCERFMKHFVNYVELFYGKVSSYMTPEDRLSEKFRSLFSHFIVNYKKINASMTVANPLCKINMLKYYDSYVNYAPIEKKSFLALHYLLNILSSIDKNIKHFTVFYYGYFIYTTLEHKSAQLFSDYFYSNSDSFEINPNKMFSKFEHVENPDTWDTNNTYGVLLNIKLNRGFVLGLCDQEVSPSTTNSQQSSQSNQQANLNTSMFVNGANPVNKPSTANLSPNNGSQSNFTVYSNLGNPSGGNIDATANDANLNTSKINFAANSLDSTTNNTSFTPENANAAANISNVTPNNANNANTHIHSNANANAQGQKKFSPIVWIKSADGKLTPYKLCIYYDSGLLVMMYYEPEHELNPNSLNEIRYAVSKNIKKCSTNLDRNIESIYAQEDTNKLYYLNKANLAMRVNKSFLKFIDVETSRIIWEMKNTFSDKSDCRVMINKVGNSWTYAKEFTSRRVFLIIDGEMPLSKIDEEKKRILGTDLPTILC